jgi:hypothetical protein
MQQVIDIVKKNPALTNRVFLPKKFQYVMSVVEKNFRENSSMLNAQ